MGELVELGDVIQGKAPRRASDEQVAIADLAGVAVLEFQISKVVYAAIGSGKRL